MAILLGQLQPSKSIKAFFAGFDQTNQSWSHCEWNEKLALAAYKHTS